MAVDINGDGLIALGGTSSTQGRLRLAEDTDNGTNYIELTAPASVGSDRVITFPDATTTVVGTDTTQTLTNKSIVATQLTGTIAVARLPAGSVLQVVSATTTAEVTSSTSVFVDTGLSVSITPTSSSSKILVLVSQNGLAKSSANVDNCLDLRLFRGATSILSPNLAACMSQTSGLNTLNVTAASISYLDSPATTSSTTYKTQFCSRNGAASVTVQFASSSTSTITLMEIAG